MDKSIFKVNIERTIKPYDEFYNLTFFSLDQARKEAEGRFYNCLITMVFCAFTLEAYLNDIGNQLVKDWDSIERDKNPYEKLSLFQEITNVKICRSTKPYCYINSIFDYRKEIVHGKTKTLNGIDLVKVDEIPKMPLTKWETMTNLENASKFRNHTKEIVYGLSKELLNEDFPLGSPSSAMWSS